MGEELGDGRIGRRELLKKGAVAGGLVWASPMVFSATAGAEHTIGACVGCPHDQLFGVKYNNGTGLEPLPTADTPGNCLTASAPFPSECLTEQQLFSPPTDGDTHTWTLEPGLEFCQAAGKVGQGTVGPGEDDCFSCGGSSDPCDGTPDDDPEPRIDVTFNADGTTTIVVSDPALSHSEIIFCYKGSPLSC